MSSSLVKAITVGKDTFEVINHPECKICQARDKNNKSLRMSIDKYIMQKNNRQTSKMLLNMGIKIGEQAIAKHVNKHSPYIQTFRDKIAVVQADAIDKGMDKLGGMYLDPDDVIQSIINIGGKRIIDGELQVDLRTLVAILKEQGTRNKKAALSDILDALDKTRFIKPVDGEVVEDANTD